MRVFLLALAAFSGMCQDSNVDPYAVLGLTKNASPKDVKNAYRKLSLKYHPDKNKKKEAKLKMMQVSDAYEMIGDPDKKVIFDEFGAGQKFHNRWQYEESQRRKGKAVSKKGFYEASEDVLTLTMRNFYQAVRGGQPVLVEFYAPWCVHCQDMVSEYKKAGVLLDGVAKVGAINCEAEKSLCNQQNIRGYPSMKLFLPLKDGNQEVEEFNARDHTAEALYSFVQTALSTDLKTLTKANFDQVTNGDLWVVDFSAGKWCGPCSGLKPHMKQAASSLSAYAKVGIVNCDEQGDLCNRLGVQFYPQLRMFYGDKTSAQGENLEVNNNFPAVGVMELFSTLVRVLKEPIAAGAAEDGVQEEHEDQDVDEEDEDDEVDHNEL